ncbi:MAG TPA: X-Pro aminopeptidase [Rhodospirillaceae bacterium]|nr:X-Pro aminopeptidase [Rhodospirillaceae bacterium]
MNDSASPFAKRLQDLRSALLSQGLDGFLVPMADPYLNEYVPPSDRRITFLSGFTGSFAFILVLGDRAVFFTDSRYTLQAKEEVSSDLFELYDTSKKTPTLWIKENLSDTVKIGFDPRLHSTSQIEQFPKGLQGKSIKLTPLSQNPIDALWHNRPTPKCEPIIPHEEKYTGKESTLKREEIAQKLKKRHYVATILTDPTSVAWLLNIRGGDVPDMPLPLCRAIVKSDRSTDLFMDPEKLSEGLHHHLGHEITIYKEEDFPIALDQLGRTKSRVLIDPTQTPHIFTDRLLQSGAMIERGDDLCALPRACKNATEIDGMRAAHRRDGAALVKLLAWLDSVIPLGKTTEIDVDKKLEAFRAEGSLHKGRSFPTIAGSGPNGAIVHYRASEKTNRTLDQNTFLLIDSGAQYLDGTTDVTRTIPIGKLTHEMRERFTRVLKGHIALASIHFPEETTGADLDVLARQYLWEIGEDYGHGTGHGVGSYLSVHEGPQSISHNSRIPLRAGMVLSNEPGFYKAGFYGIRHENLQYVTQLPDISLPERKMLGFETLTLVPFDRRGIIIEMLTQTEKDWLNAYHTRIEKALRPQLDNESSAWLLEATALL